MTALSGDDSEIGIYEAQLDLCMDEYPDIETQVDFKVIVSPCQVTEIILNDGQEDTRYAISTAEKMLATPSLDQGVCKYPVTYEILEPKPFMTINEKTGEIAIQTDIRSLDDIYSVSIKASISVPTDHSNTDVIIHESTHTFELELFVPLELCSLTLLDETVLVDMQTSVLGEPKSQSFEEVQDSESKDSGDNSGLTFCGPRVCSIIGSPPYIQFDP